MRLIDADALELEPKQSVMNRVLFVGRSAGKTIAQVQNTMRVMIDNAPTIEAKPVRHSYWKSRGNFLECSECEHEFTQYDWEGSIVAYYYCPNCGAKMDEGDY